MQHIKRIIATTDTSESLSDEIRVAAALAKITGGTLDVLHVIDRVEEIYGIAADMAEENLLHKAATSLDAICADLNVSANIHVRHDAPFEVISRFAEENNCDLIVINVSAYEGSQGGPSELGIIAKRLAHKLPYDMVFVRNGDDGNYTNMVVATDFSNCATDALMRAIVLAKASGIAKIPVVHAYEVPPTYYRAGHTEEETLKLIVGHAERHFEEWLAKIDNKSVQIERVLIRGKAAPVICDYARQHNCDLVVVGTHGRTASAAVLLGNVAERIIRLSPCSVWAERDDGQALSFGRAVARLMGLKT